MSNINQEAFERARKKSVKETKIELSKEKVLKMFKRAAVVNILAGMLLASSVMIGVDKFSEAIDRNAIVSEEAQFGKSIVSRHTHRTADNKNYYFDTTSIAYDLMDDMENYPENLYGVYRGIDYKVVENMNSIFYIVHNSQDVEKKWEFQDYSSLTDFCEAKGFKNDQGVDYEAFMKYLHKIIIAKHNAEEYEAQVSAIRK